MSLKSLALVPVGALAIGLVGCVSKGNTTTGSSGTGGGTSSTNILAGVGGGWSATSIQYNPQDNWEQGLTGIWFKDPDHGVVTIASPDQMGGPGAVIAMTGSTKQGAILVDGQKNAATMATANNLNFATLGALQQSAYGLVALSSANAFVASTDAGTSFNVTASGLKGTGTLVFEGNSAAGWFAVDMTNDGFRQTMSSPPSASSMWSSISVPLCGNQLSVVAAYQSPDGKTIIAADEHTEPPAVCRSTDGGKTFNLVAMPNPPAATQYGIQGPNVLTFGDPMHGLVVGADDLNPGVGTLADPWVYSTSDGGATWTKSVLPAGDGFTDPTSYVLLTAFWAPDAQHVWIAGGHHKGGPILPLLYASSDGGKTFSDASQSLASALSTVKGKLYDFGVLTGFALDATHVWLGGRIQIDTMKRNYLLYSQTGGM